MNEFANNIIYLRKVYKLNQTQFGDLFGKNHATISKWELGERTPIVADTILIANYFHISLEDLLFTNLSINTQIVEYGNMETELIDMFKKLDDVSKQSILNIVRSMSK